ncbi:MAG: hypothetical protein ABSC53_03185 [Bacteroidota bacterium]
MKLLIMIALLFVLIAQVCFPKNTQPNVLSYYAVGNSLDGQPMVDMLNVLRFFPVYAMQEQIDSVRVTIYYGGKIFSRYADPLEGNAYWEVMLPEFKLGEAIQRLEVETQFRLTGAIKNRLQLIKSIEDTVQADIQRINDDLKLNEDEFKERKKVFSKAIEDVNNKFKNLGISKSEDVDKLRRTFEGGIESYLHTRDSTLKVYNIPPDDTTLIRIELLTRERSENLRQYLMGYEAFREDSKEKKKLIAVKNLHVIVLQDSLINELAKEVEVGLLDTTYSGISVRKSDLTIDSDFVHAHILYRNYKSALRHLLTLDAAERMGIFRVRYVPFPIVGTTNRPRPTLMRPLNSSSPTVFEIGLAFGDAIVPGDDFVVPEFSWRRLGVAFAITEKLFNDDADIVGLALTYDFNSYGSIGIGGNFAHNETHGYASLGINKKAFEAAIKGLAGLFK